MSITDPGHGPGHSESTTSRPKPRATFGGTRTWTPGALGTMDFTARVGAACAGLCALLFLGCMTYTLAHHRDWAGPAAFVVALVFAALALLTAAPYVIRRDQPAAGLLPRLTMWGTGIVLAGLQLTAGVLGDAEFSMVAVIGIVAVLAVPCFGELAGQAGAPAGGTRAGKPLGAGRRAPSAPAATAEPAAAPGAAPKPAAGSASDETARIPAVSARREASTPRAEDHVEPAAPAAGTVPPPPQERPVADRMRKTDRLRKD